MLLFLTTNNLIYLSCHSHNFHVFAIAKKDNNLICFIVQLLLCASISTGIVYLTDTREINMISIKILITQNYENFPSGNYKHLVIMMMRGEGVLVARVIPANLWQEVWRGRQRGDEKSHRSQVHVFTVFQYFKSLGSWLNVIC